MRNDPMLIATVLKDVDDSEEKVVPGPAGAEATYFSVGAWDCHWNFRRGLLL